MNRCLALEFGLVIRFGSAMAKLDQQIETLQAKLQQLKTRQQNIETRKRAISAKRERKADTRRKILVGAIVMAKIQQKLMDETLLRGWLDEALTRRDDRALFGLPPVTIEGNP